MGLEKSCEFEFVCGFPETGFALDTDNEHSSGASRYGLHQRSSDDSCDVFLNDVFLNTTDFLPGHRHT